MNKPLTSWKNVLTALGRQVNWQNFYRQRQRKTETSNSAPLCLELEKLESRTLLSSVTELLVTTTADVVNANDGVTSLREAITFANSDADASVITFASGAGEAFAGDAVILLTGGELDITEDATIDGSNAGGELVVDGNGSQSVFRSNFQGFSADISITFDGLTITGAETGIDSEAEETTINATLQAS